MKKIYLIGGGGHCLSVIDVIEAQKKYEIKGIFDQSIPTGGLIHGYPALGDDQIARKYIQSEHSFILTVGQIVKSEMRRTLFALYSSWGAEWATIISPLAYVSPRASVGSGTVVMHGSIVNAGAQIGQNCILNTNSLVEHGAKIGNHCHVSTGSIVNGDATLGDGVFLGSNGTIVQARTIDQNQFIQAGTFVGNKR